VGEVAGSNPVVPTIFDVAQTLSRRNSSSQQYVSALSAGRIRSRIICCYFTHLAIRFGVELRNFDGFTVSKESGLGRGVEGREVPFSMDNPDVLILDEPLSGLDVPSALIIKSLIQGLSARGKTVFYCSHILEAVEKVCSHLTILRKGKVIAQGATSEVRERIGKSSLEGAFLQLVEEQDVSQVANDIVDVVVSA
jgi:hypothetical protein